MQQVWYLHDYLEKEWHPKTIVIEETYVDGDYLGDYTSFYATAFAKFDRFCKRVHFFIDEFDEELFQQYILREAVQAKQEEFEQSYLGFSVIRPLPQALIGRTLLRTYPALPGDGDERCYTAVRNYTANLFGLRLQITNSLPFQQQDSVVAACATVALWSAFHKTAELFGTAAPRPSEITRNATANVFQERAFPSTGLTVEQMCDAIRANSLEPEALRLEKHLEVPALSWLRAYLAYGIPLILGVRIPQAAPTVAIEDGQKGESGQEDDPNALSAEKSENREERTGSLHAITVVGYRVSSSPVRVREARVGSYEAPSMGRRMTELYCHDDNLGAFAKYQILTDPEGGNLRLTADDYGVEITIDNVIAPVYHKIRLPFPEMQKWISVIDGALLGLIDEQALAAREWDVRLIDNMNLKDEIRGSSIPRDERLRLVFSSEPRFLWSGILSSAGKEIVRIYADATSISRSLPIRYVRFATLALHQNVVDVLQDGPPEATRLSRYLSEALETFKEWQAAVIS